MSEAVELVEKLDIFFYCYYFPGPSSTVRTRKEAEKNAEATYTLPSFA
jgi:hypothetical protein